MKTVEQFIAEHSRTERKSMLNLNENCHERGLKYSTQLIALVAYHYDTTLPENGNKIVVCHGCNNPKCSNPNHMYWGTKGDNKLDDYEAGKGKSIYQHLVEKYGVEEAKKKQKQNGSLGGKKAQQLLKNKTI
jgi:hypothetical protein